MKKLYKINGVMLSNIDPELKSWQSIYNSELEETQIISNMPSIRMPGYHKSIPKIITGIYLTEDEFLMFKLGCGHLLS